MSPLLAPFLAALSAPGSHVRAHRPQPPSTGSPTSARDRYLDAANTLEQMWSTLGHEILHLAYPDRGEDDIESTTAAC